MAKTHPTLSWIPVRIFPAVLNEKTMTVDQWLHKAAEFKLPAVEVYSPFLQQDGLSTVEKVKATMDRLGLKASLVTCSPDLTHPNKEIRRQAIASVEKAIQDAAAIGATGIRCTTGQAHPGLERQEGLKIVSDALMRLAEYAKPFRIQIALENHYRDRMCMEYPDFAHTKDIFLELFDLVKDSPVMINLDCSNPLMVGENAVDILKVVKSKVISVHASDRKKGSYQHSPVGEGDVDYPTILSTLADDGYNGWISIEDGQPEGDEGFKRSLAYLQGAIEKYWG